MNDIQTLTDQVRAILASENYDDTTRLTRTAKSYAAVVSGLNTRLQRCGEFLRQGLRTEAIQQAESEPQLLDAVGILAGLTDDEQKAWGELCQYLEVPVPEPLLTDAAVMLDEAYQDFEPIRDLLTRHRRLAIQRASLQKRLEVVRQLADRDPNTEFWEADVVEYENVRLQEIRGILKSQRQSPDAETLSELLTELQSDKWTRRISAKMIAAAEQLYDAGIRNQAIRRLKSAEAALRQAFSEMNLAAARPALEQWKSALPDAELDDDHPLILEALPAISWCEEEIAGESREKQWNDLLYDIERVLEVDSPADEELRRVQRAAARHDRPLPAALATRLQNAVSVSDRRKRRKRLLVGATLAGVLLAVGVGVVGAIQVVQDRSTREDTIARVDELLEAGDIVPAEKLVAEFEGRWTDFPVWAEAKGRVATAREQLDERTERIDTLIGDAEGLALNKQSGFRRLRDEALRLAGLSPVIKGLVSDTEQRLGGIERDRATRISNYEDEIRSRLAAQSSAIEDAELELMAPDPGESTTQLVRIRSALDVIRQDAEGFDETLLTETALLDTALGELEQKFKTVETRAKVVEQLAQLSRWQPGAGTAQLDQYVATLEALHKLWDDSEHKSDLAKSVEESAFWKKALRFSRFKHLEIFPETGSAVSSQKNDINVWLKGPRLFPLQQNLTEYLNYLNLLGRRYSGSNSLVKQTRKLFQQEAFNLYSVPRLPGTKRGSEYDPGTLYLPDGNEIIPDDGKVELRLWSAINKRRFERGRSDRPIRPQPSPQRKLRDELTPGISGLSTWYQWESGFAAMADRVAQANDVDAILRVYLLNDLLEIMERGSWAVGDHQPFQEFRTALKNTSDGMPRNRTDWAMPGEATKEREIAVSFLNQIESDGRQLRGICVPDDVSEFGGTVRALLDHEYATVGWMAVDGQGDPRVAVDPPGAGMWTLCIIAPADEESATATITEIGSVENGVTRMTRDATGRYFQFGRPVFARSAAKERVRSGADNK